jgi:hypothetical protein
MVLNEKCNINTKLLTYVSLKFKEGLKRKLKDFYLNMEWIERMDVTVAKDQLTIKGLENKQGEELSKELIDNDFKREGLFLKQAEAAVNRSLSLL